MLMFYKDAVFKRLNTGSIYCSNGETRDVMKNKKQ